MPKRVVLSLGAFFFTLGVVGCSSSTPSSTDAGTAPSATATTPTSGPGLACVQGEPGRACGCFLSDAGNDVECSPAVTGGGACCSFPESGCTCGQVACSKQGTSCQCMRDGPTSNAASCPKPAGGQCCLTATKDQCICNEGASPCPPGNTPVDSCAPQTVEKPCGTRPAVAKCSK